MFGALSLNVVGAKNGAAIVVVLSLCALLALPALVLRLRGAGERSRRRLALAALGALAVLLAVVAFGVLGQRATADGLFQNAKPCYAEIYRHDAYVEAALPALIALWLSPPVFVVSVAALIGDRGLGRALQMLSFGVPAALLLWVSSMALARAPGHPLNAYVCGLFDTRDDVQSADTALLRRGCLDLEHTLRREPAAGTPSIVPRAESVLPNLDTFAIAASMTCWSAGRPMGTRSISNYSGLPWSTRING